MKKIEVFQLSDGSIEHVESVAIAKEKELKTLSVLNDYLKQCNEPNSHKETILSFMKENINQLTTIFKTYSI